MTLCVFYQVQFFSFQQTLKLEDGPAVQNQMPGSTPPVHNRTVGVANNLRRNRPRQNNVRPAPPDPIPLEEAAKLVSYNVDTQKQNVSNFSQTFVKKNKNISVTSL